MHEIRNIEERQLFKDRSIGLYFRLLCLMNTGPPLYLCLCINTLQRKASKAGNISILFFITERKDRYLIE